MKAIEFQAQLDADRTLVVPRSVSDAIPVGRTLRVLILIPESDVDQEWERLASEEFGQGYAETDAIYDHPSSG
jgi:hypothetical protein